jgi:polyisoprenyl-phosphate glycosyltransferase
MPISNGKISVVIPVYKSEASLETLVSRLLVVLEELGRNFEIILVDDCSPDNSWEVLKKLKKELGKALKIVNLLTNSGQHNAILCGFSLSTGDIIVTMDDDLQNSPEEIPKFVKAIDQGYDLAIGAYDAKKHAGIRNASSSLIDWLIRRIFNLPQDFQLTSFRASKRVVIDNVCRMSGVFPYVTCMLLSHTSKYTNVSIRREPRLSGKSNYNLKRSLGLAANLIINYSPYPLYIVGALCFFAFLFSIGYGTITLYRALVHGTSVPGWTSTVVIIAFFNAVTLLCLFIFGVYISRINQQLTRSRVSYTINELYD